MPSIDTVTGTTTVQSTGLILADNVLISSETPPAGIRHDRYRLPAVVVARHEEAAQVRQNS
jgi:hypothetical protein